jgi:hypothetical protein
MIDLIVIAACLSPMGGEITLPPAIDGERVKIEQQTTKPTLGENQVLAPSQQPQIVQIAEDQPSQENSRFLFECRPSSERVEDSQEI